jgi:heme/copper-type cytochrome/quinol oxidase subunit 4
MIAIRYALKKTVFGNYMSEKLPLVNRYHAAWIEHGTRVAQRQNAVQIYLASVTALFGLYFSGIGQSDGKDSEIGIGHFLFFGTTFLSIAGTSLVWMHHRVMQNLCAFMARCERCAVDEIRQSAAQNSEDLFYFYDYSTKKLQGFHAWQRLLHRIILSAIFVTPPFAAIYLVSRHLNIWTIIGCVVLLIAVTMVPYMDLNRDKDGA